MVLPSFLTSRYGTLQNGGGVQPTAKGKAYFPMNLLGVPDEKPGIVLIVPFCRAW
jgi:hypothetical protein